MISPPKAPVLLVNPRSGGGKAHHHDLVARCRAWGIEPLPLEPGDDIAAVATAAVLRGADMIGMAGGDGSQAAAAAVAAEHGLPYIVVPAGTRNHFALDIGVAPDNVVGSLGAFFDGRERRVDLARVNGHVFVNNASMGLYGRLVKSRQYRDAKLRTVIEMLPEVLGRQAEPFDLRFTDPEGFEHVGAQLLLVSNNRYELDPLAPQGARGKIDKGTLGVVAVHLAPPPSRRVWEWTTPEFQVCSGGPVDVGLDGEAVAIEPPLVFESLPSALRVRTIDQAKKPRRVTRHPFVGTSLQDRAVERRGWRIEAPRPCAVALAWRRQRTLLRRRFRWPMMSAFALAPGELRVAAGKAARLRAPLESHGEFSRSASSDPIGLLLGQAGSRDRTWCRSVMAECSCRRSRTIGVRPYRWRPIWPAHLRLGSGCSCAATRIYRNFGVFGSPERRVVFDLNDFDETLPGPFEWDVKRLVTSFAIAGRENGFPAKVRRAVTLATGAAYRTVMGEFARHADP